MLGQDPYPDPKHAIGRAFAVPNEVKRPPSLNALVAEISRSTGDFLLGLHEDYPFDNTLQHWTDQGVMLLNVSLSVEEGRSGSHAKYWIKSRFIAEVIKFLDEYNNPIIFCMLGRVAQRYSHLVDENRNYLIELPHPVNDAYPGSKVRFYGCGLFDKVNDIIENMNGKEYRINFAVSP